MPIDNSAISIVMQGGLRIGFDIAQSLRSLRAALPGASIILSTQREQVTGAEDLSGFDEVVLTPDPGALPCVKLKGAPNNVNRQIASSHAGLQAVRTPYAMKLRTDAYLTSRSVVDRWSALAEASRGAGARGRARILTVSFFTWNPRFDERIPFHVSDWFQFGRTEDLRDFWSCPPCDLATAVHYEDNPYAEGSLPRERKYRSRFAAEQWLTLNYLYRDGDFPIAFHNDCSARIIRQFEDDLVDEFIVLHPLDIDLHMPKHEAVYRSRYANLRNYSFEDWKRLAAARRGLVTGESGFTMWPRTPMAKTAYLLFRNKGRADWLRNR